jgi:acyl dehydratase
MLTLETPRDLLGQIGRELGPSEWVTITQEMINAFADATGDHQWIHVDVERAKREMPGGKTIAHGYLTLSLLPRLVPALMTIRRRRRGINYGCNRVRFTAPVPAGSRIRLRQKLLKAEEIADHGVRLTSEMVMEVEGQDRPAMVAETISIVYGEPQ